MGFSIMIDATRFRHTIFALQKIRPEGRFTLYEDGTIDWDEDNITEKPTQAEIDTAIDEVLLEIPLKQLRAKRDELITETDWWVLPDRTPTDEQLAYRQTLRDITNTYTSLDDVVWPEKPV
jgi:hypothetical protein